LHQTRTQSKAKSTTGLHQPLSEAFEPSQAMQYSLSYNLKKEMGLKYIVLFGKYYRGDIFVDHFANSEEEDAETWVTDFCHWASQENLRDSWKLKFLPWRP
jgi:hypothetical protein